MLLSWPGRGKPEEATCSLAVWGCLIAPSPADHDQRVYPSLPATQWRDSAKQARFSRATRSESSESLWFGICLVRPGLPVVGGPMDKSIVQGVAIRARRADCTRVRPWHYDSTVITVAASAEPLWHIDWAPSLRLSRLRLERSLPCLRQGPARCLLRVLGEARTQAASHSDDTDSDKPTSSLHRGEACQFHLATGLPAGGGPGPGRHWQATPATLKVFNRDLKLGFCQP
jgi:hypothetical protein